MTPLRTAVVSCSEEEKRTCDDRESINGKRSEHWTHTGDRRSKSGNNVHHVCILWMSTRVGFVHRRGDVGGNTGVRSGVDITVGAARAGDL